MAAELDVSAQISRPGPSPVVPGSAASIGWMGSKSGVAATVLVSAPVGPVIAAANCMPEEA